MPQQPATVLVVVSGGVAEVYTWPHVEAHVIDVDNIKAGDPKPVLPRGRGFEELVEEAGVRRYVRFERKKV
jgi:hypothetical protein